MFVCTCVRTCTRVCVRVFVYVCVCGGGAWMCTHVCVCVFVMCVYTYSRVQHAKLECAHSLQAHDRDPTSASILHYVTVIDCIYMPSLHASLSLLLRTTLSPFAHVYSILSSWLLALTWLLWACSGHSLVYLRNDNYQP